MLKDNFFSADIAHQKSIDNFENNIGNILTKIFNIYIIPTINKGLFQVSVPSDYITEHVKDYLTENLGYQLNFIQCGLQEYEYQISW